MRILCISATKLEIDPLLRKLSVSPDQSVDQLDISYKKHRIKFRITGIGKPWWATTPTLMPPGGKPGREYLTWIMTTTKRAAVSLLNPLITRKCSGSEA